MYLFFRLTESDLLWSNTAPLHWKASRVYQILLHPFCPSRCSGPSGTGACLHTYGGGWSKSAWWRQSELKWGEPEGLWDLMCMNPSSSIVCWALNSDADPTSVRIHGDSTTASSWLSNYHVHDTVLGLVTRCHSCWYGQVKFLIAVKSTLNIGVRQCKAKVIIAVTDERQGATDAEFLWKEINKLKSALLGFFHGKDSDKDVNAVTWKQEWNKKRNRGQGRQELKNH